MILVSVAGDRVQLQTPYEGSSDINLFVVDFKGEKIVGMSLSRGDIGNLMLSCMRILSISNGELVGRIDQLEKEIKNKKDK